MANLNSDFRSWRFALMLHTRRPRESASHRTRSGTRRARLWRVPVRPWLCRVGWTLVMAVLLGQEAGATGVKRPLAALDTQSPQATLAGFLATIDDALRLTRDELLNSGTSDTRIRTRVIELYAKAARAFDVSQVPPEAQGEVSRDAALHLYEVLARIDLPPEHEIPGAESFAESRKNAKWTLPDTEITLARVDEGERAGEFLFSPTTGARAREFYDRTRDLPLVRDVPLTNIVERQANRGGLLVPPHVIERFPAWSKQLVLGQGLWKWLTIAVVLGVGLTVVLRMHRLARLTASGHSVGTQLRRLLTPVALLLLMQFLIYLTTNVVNARGQLAEAVTLAAGAISYLAGAGAAWRAAVTVAEWIIMSPRIPDQSLDAHMLRLAGRVVGIF